MPPFSPFSLSDFVSPLPPPAGVIGIGVDIAQVQRVSRAAQGRGFVRQVFSIKEREAWATPDSFDAQSLARAFSLKEAFFKALGTGQRLDMLFNEISFEPLAAEGALSIVGRTAEVANALGVNKIDAQSVVSEGIAVGWVVLTA